MGAGMRGDDSCEESGPGGRAGGACRKIASVVLLFVLLAFIVVIVGSVTLGRWLQRKGRDMEKGRDDGPR
jgi:hypothetical protein